MQEAFKELEAFVQDTCGHRPPSHSAQHMRQVVIGAQEIYRDEHPRQNPLLDPLYFMVTVTSWLHDVADHKYIENEPDLVNEVESFLKHFTQKYRSVVRDSDYDYLFTSKNILAITERFSFSREKKYGRGDWLKRLGPQGVLIRNYGSDSDKWQAIGRHGIRRCRDYALEKAGDMNEPLSHKVLVDRVVTHYHEKLKLISMHYLCTPLGKSRGELLNQEMQQALVDLEAGTL